MKTDEKILKEIARYNSINKYIFEQDAPPPPPAEVIPEPAGDVPPPPGGDIPAPPDTPGAAPAPATPSIIDVEADKDVEKIDSKGESEEKGGETEELEITDLVSSQKNIETKQEEYFDSLFKQLEGLQSKLGEMDGLVQKLNDIETKLDKYREKTPEERLELRTLDSGPYNQKLSDFFTDKMSDMEKSGKNEYVLTSDEVQNFSPNEIKKTFASGLPSLNTRNYNSN